MSKIIVGNNDVTLVQKDDDGKTIKTKVGFFGWIKAKILNAKTISAEDYIRDIEPTNCPICNGRIEQKSGSDSYVCIGLVNREEVEAHHPMVKKIPEDVVSIPSCGWHGLASEYGETWA